MMSAREGGPMVMDRKNVHFDMRTCRVTYGELDKLLSRLGFVRHQGAPKWVWYEHVATGTEIILADKKPDEVARPSEIVSTRVHLVTRGLMNEEEIDDALATGPSKKETDKQVRPQP